VEVTSARRSVAIRLSEKPELLADAPPMSLVWNNHQADGGTGVSGSLLLSLIVILDNLSRPCCFAGALSTPKAQPVKELFSMTMEKSMHVPANQLNIAC